MVPPNLPNSGGVAMSLKLPLPLLFAAALLAGCSAGSSLSTSSIFGGSSSTPAAAPALPASTPMARALQVGGTSARATKCGYNFDGNKLRANFMAAEATATPGGDMANVQKAYDTAYSGVSKAAATKPDYCSPEKTKDIKAALNRHLAGDYSPDAPKPEPVEDGLFSGWGNSSAPEFKASLPTDNSRD